MLSLKYFYWRLTYMITVLFIHVSGKAVFEKSNQIDLTKNYEAYQLDISTPRSLMDCALICQNLENCRSVLMSHTTGICRAFDTDISQYAGSATLPDDSFSFLREKAFDLVEGQGDHSWQVGTIIATEGFSYLALDGDTTSQWSGMSCMHTNDVFGPWWAVDIGGIAKIKRIHIYQRTDTCCVDRFANINFMVADTVTDINNNAGTVLATYTGPASSTPLPIVIEATTAVKGRYLKVYKEAAAVRENLCFCEIKVFPF